MLHTLDDFDFDLPAELIAQRPAQPRDHARLLVYNRNNKSITDDFFYNLKRHLHPKTTLVLNNSKVEKARLKFGKLEIFLLETVNDTTARALVYPGRQFKRQAVLRLANGITATVIDINQYGQRTLRFSAALDDPLYEAFKRTPLPPYIRYDESLTDEYQTVYAKPLGSKAAPTAGLHFTDELLQAIKTKHAVAEVTLHVGLGTFAPLLQDNLRTGRLHQESYSIDQKAAGLINAANHLTAVGTTSARVLESEGRPLNSGNFTTDIFIQPDDDFQTIDSLITNFHLPKSSLLLLVAAFTSREEMLQIYAHAVNQGYRFYSFGDCMLIN